MKNFMDVLILFQYFKRLYKYDNKHINKDDFLLKIIVIC